MIIGKFTKDSAERFSGCIFGFSSVFSDRVQFAPQEKGADFIVTEITDKMQYEIGAAWRKTSKAGKPYLSVKLDGPALPAPVNCALTKEQEVPSRRWWNWMVA